MSVERSIQPLRRSFLLLLNSHRANLRINSVTFKALALIDVYVARPTLPYLSVVIG